MLLKKYGKKLINSLHFCIMCGQNIDLYYNTVLKLVEQSGKIIKEKTIIRNKYIETKSSATDLVTETDSEVEKLLIDNLSQLFPDHNFIGEESTAKGKKPVLTDAPTWIIDPIDGTMNFVHSFPHSCVSIALFINQQPEIGIVHNPMLNQLFTARRGKGAFLNGERIKVSDKKPLHESLISTEMFRKGSPSKTKIDLENYAKMLEESHGLRSLGSAALDMCMVACGAVEAYYQITLSIWDLAAGELIVTEAGGVVVDTTGKALDRFNKRVLAANSNELAQVIGQKLKQYNPKTKDGD